MDDLRGIVLSYGCFDLSILPSLALAPSALPILTRVDAERFMDAFLPGTSCAERKRGDISPLYNDLAGLCPALFLVGTEDALVDDSVLMHFRWRRAGNAADLLFIPGAPHGFMTFDAAKADTTRQGYRHVTEFLTR